MITGGLDISVGGSVALITMASVVVMENVPQLMDSPEFVSIVSAYLYFYSQKYLL